jgi:predicted helicase
MMAPYAVGHLKMSFLLEELGYSLTSEDRFKMYLTNTLEMNELEHTRLPGMSSLSEESHLAGRIKREKPILVILGNPPYSVSSANRSEFIDKEMDVYKKDVQGEKNLQPLSDDYIKFIRFAHWKIDNTGAGLIGMITNNGYLSGLIHRGMRKRLLESFNEIYILNLHGNSRIGEKCPDGTKDENVFDIQQGVSIALFVKNEGSKEAGRVFYHDLFGLQDIKYEYLKENNKDTTQWTELKPVEPYYFLVKKDFTHQGEYDKFVSISEIFDAFSTGVTTHRDHFVIGFTKDEIRQRMRTFTSDLPDDLVSQGLDLQDTKDWKLKDAREKVKKIDWQNYIRECSYRPFDDRIICYLPDLMNRSRWDLMQNFFDENMGLLISRQQNKTGFYHAFVSENIADKHCIGDQSFIFPLYLYPDKNKDKLLNHNNHQERHPNIKPEFYKILEQLYNKRPDPEEILYYIYGILYSNIYRKKYAEFLKIDFPKIPFVKNLEIFDQIAGLGKRLVSLHLLKSPTLDTPITKYQGTGDNRVKEIKYHEIEKKVFINKTQFFEEIDKEVWEYQIGGYQVCCKWLKDRKDRILTLDEIKHYCRFSTSLYQTIEIQKEIDLIKIA